MCKAQISCRTGTFWEMTVYSPRVGLTMPFTEPYGKKKKNGKSLSPRRA